MAKSLCKIMNTWTIELESWETGTFSGPHNLLQYAYYMAGRHKRKIFAIGDVSRIDKDLLWDARSGSNQQFIRLLSEKLRYVQCIFLANFNEVIESRKNYKSLVMLSENKKSLSYIIDFHLQTPQEQSPLFC